MSELLRDVDEMMRQERLKQIWEAYGNYIIGGVLALILAVALHQGYQSWSTSKARANTAALQQALEAKDVAPALAAYADARGGNAAAVANLLRAEQLMMADKVDDARAVLLAVRNDARAHIDLRELATLNWVRLSASAKDADATALLNALAPLMRDDGQPFAWSARVEAAVIQAHLNKNYQAAIDLLAPMVNNPGLPYTQAERAEALSQLYKLRRAGQ